MDCLVESFPFWLMKATPWVTQSVPTTSVVDQIGNDGKKLCSSEGSWPRGFAFRESEWMVRKEMAMEMTAGV